MTAEDFRVGGLYFSVLQGGYKLIIGGNPTEPQFLHINATPLIHRSGRSQSGRIKAHSPQLSRPGQKIAYELLQQIEIYAGTDDDIQIGDEFELYEEGELDRYQVIATSEPKLGLLHFIGELIK